jgi:hypothetical protein
MIDILCSTLIGFGIQRKLVRLIKMYFNEVVNVWLIYFVFRMRVRVSTATLLELNVAFQLLVHINELMF